MPESPILPVLRSRVEYLESLSGSSAFYPFSAQLLDWVFTQPEFARPLEQIGLEFKHLVGGFQAQQEAFRQEAGLLLGRFCELFPERRDDNVQRAGEHGLPTLAYHGSLKRAEDILAGQDLYALGQPLEPAKFGDDRTPVGALLRILEKAFQRETEKNPEVWADDRTEPLFLDLAHLTDQQHQAVAALQMHLPSTPGSVVQNLLQIRQALLGTSKRYGSLAERSRDLMAIPPLHLNFLVQVRAEAGGEREPDRELRQRTLQLWATLLEELSLRLARQAATLRGEQTAMPVIGTPTVLFITANPADRRLWIDEEMKRVQDELRTSTHRNALQVVREDAARGEDFLRLLNRYQPQLLHFSGHGDEESLTFVDAEGSTLPLSHDQVVEALRIAGGVRVAVFMACHSDAVAGRVVEFVDVAVGMATELDDVVAPMFSAHFYQALAEGQSVRQAFDTARWAFKTNEATRDEPWIASLHMRDGVDAETLRVANLFSSPVV